MTHPFDLTGRVAIVTGAGSGIGRACAHALRRLGARVIATDIDLNAAQETVAIAGGDGIAALRHDVTSADDWRAVFQAAAGYGRLDVLVNNAGIMLSHPFEKSSVEHLRKQYEINVEGAFMGTQGALPLMKASIAEHGAAPSIVNVASIYGMVSGARFSAYSASKGAVRMLTKSTAFELAPCGIRVNSVLPGPTQTNLGIRFEAPIDASGAVIPREAVIADLVRQIPMGRFGTVEDIAPVIAFLASDASRYMTGAELVVDGGYTTK